jgi:hypothetical protein
MVRPMVRHGAHELASTMDIPDRDRLIGGFVACCRDAIFRTRGSLPRADPDNIAARQAVRERGLKLLRTLHAGSRYSRIVIVSHSLALCSPMTFLAYFWAEREAARSIQDGTSGSTRSASLKGRQAICLLVANWPMRNRTMARRNANWASASKADPPPPREHPQNRILAC